MAIMLFFVSVAYPARNHIRAFQLLPITSAILDLSSRCSLLIVDALSCSSAFLLDSRCVAGSLAVLVVRIAWGAMCERDGYEGREVEQGPHSGTTGLPRVLGRWACTVLPRCCMVCAMVAANHTLAPRMTVK
eukprot:GHUV01028647.1.p1 GENE.GHUV01028647.1~~GHUV01028647.1.p1  ORF type:complete len:132 (+),score=3.95 GHUV01028647.1:184-579(+)